MHCDRTATWRNVMDVCRHCHSRELVWFTPRRYARPGIVLCRLCDRVSVLIGIGGLVCDA